MPAPPDVLPAPPDALGPATERLRLLHAITAPEGGAFEDRVRRALALTTTLLGYDTGILSRVRGDAYTVVACHAPHTELSPGATFPLGDTYCSLTLEHGGLLSIEHMARSAHRRHPCYEAFALESYAGLPVFRNGTAWGTLNVSSATPATAALSEADGDLLRVLASWIGGELERQDLAHSVGQHELRLRTVLARAPLVLYAFDADGTVTLHTGDSCSPFDVADGGPVGRPLADLLAPGSPAARQTAAVFSGASGFWTTERDGCVLETTVEPIYDDEGRVAGGVGVSMDVTEREQAAAALRESEMRYRMLSSATTEGIAFSRDGVVLDCNHQLARLFGRRSPADLVGTPAATLVAPEFRDLVQAKIRETQAAPYEAVCLRAGGERFWAEIKSQPVAYGGETVRMTAVRDVSAQKEAEAQTRFHADVLRHVSDAVIALDLDGRVTYWNAGAERIHGLHAGRMLGRKLDEVVRYKIDEDAAVPPAAGAESMLRESDTFGHLVYTTPLGARRYVSVSSSVLRDERDEARGMLAVVRDVTEQHQMSVQLQHQAYHDALTGLPNRAWFRVKVERALARGRPFGVLFIDLDHFKVVNDSLGHDAGDRLLTSVAGRLRESLGPTEGAVVSRLGGDEFGVLLPGRPAHVTATAAAVLRAFDAPVTLGLRTLSPAGSVGVVATGSLYDELDDLLRDADTAMYVAKRSGRNQVCVFDEAMHQDAKARFQMEQDLRLAIDRDQLRLRLQPIVDLETLHVAGFEALVRWEHPDQGLVSPGVFVPLAEEINLVPAIDRWVLEATCRELAGWDLAGSSLLVSVNCSDQTLLSDGLGELAERAVSSAGLPTSMVALELTERALIDATASTDTLEALRAQGFQILVDDFGSGYSSLGLLHTLPVDGLKIDQSFVADLESSPSARAVVRAVAQMTRDLGLRSVAEGIETREQLHRLRELGCTLGQGYLFSHPVPPDEARSLIGRPLAV